MGKVCELGLGVFLSQGRDTAAPKLEVKEILFSRDDAIVPTNQRRVLDLSRGGAT